MFHWLNLSPKLPARHQTRKCIRYRYNQESALKEHTLSEKEAVFPADSRIKQNGDKMLLLDEYWDSAPQSRHKVQQRRCPGEVIRDAESQLHSRAADSESTF